MLSLSDTDLRSVFDQRCAASADNVAYSYIPGSGQIATLSYAQLHRQVGAVVAELERRTAVGDRVVLLMPAGLPWVIAFWACVVSGRVAVPLAEPRGDHLLTAREKLQRFIDDARPTLVCLPPDHALRNHDEALGLPCLTVTVADDPAPWPQALPALTADHLAYLQYTSGSTGQPRGVMITHGNVMGQARAVIPHWGLDASSRTLCWLPLFHDYGLVTGVLMPLISGGRSDLLATLAFMRDPLNWWRVAAEQRTTHTGGPHFAYAVSVQALTARPDWTADLSALRFVSCGAEPIQALTIQEWWRVSARLGVAPESFTPGYGMAESVLALTSHHPMRAKAVLLGVDREALQRGAVELLSPEEMIARAGQTVVGCGEITEGVTLRIVSPETCATLGDDQVGEVWVQGATVGQGYWGHPERSAEAFGAHTAEGDGPWLRTGDLGFLHEGQLYITGRCKDLLIVHGRNFYPQDLEWVAARAHPVCLAGRGVAVAYEGTHEGWPGEALAIVQEITSDIPMTQWPEVVSAIRAAVADAFELPVQAVVLLRRGRLPRTSSGKVQRNQTRADWLAGRLADVYLDDRLDRSLAEQAETDDAPLDEVEAAVQTAWQIVLGLPRVGLHVPFFDLGGHSLTATQVMARLSAQFGLALPVHLLFEHPTIAGLAQAVRALRDSGRGQTTSPIQAVRRDGGPLPVSFSQQRMWLVQQMEPDTTAYNIPVAIRLSGPLQLEPWLAALQALCERHEVFHMRFGWQDGRPVQWLGPCLPPVVDHVDAQSWPRAERDERVAVCLRQAASHVFDLTQPPLHRCMVIRLAPDDHIVLWVLHHILADQWSATVLWREWAELYNARLQRRAPQLPPQRIDQADHAHWQREAVQAQLMTGQLSYWRRRLEDLQPVPLPTDHAWRPGQPMSGARLTRALSPELQAGLQRLGVQYGVTPYMVMLACLSMLVARYTQHDDVVIGTPVANRTHFDTAGLVGTLVNTLPMRTVVHGDRLFADWLAQVRQGTLEAYSHQDLSFDYLVEQLGAEQRGHRLPLGIEVMLNVQNAPMGEVHIEGLSWALHPFDRGSTQFPLSFNVDTEIAKEITLEYASNLFHADTATRWLDQFCHLLDAVTRDPQRKVADYDLCTDADLRTQYTWNDTAQRLPLNQRVDQCVLAGMRRASQPVLRHPATQAQWDADTLQRRVRQLARAMRACGVERGQRVGLFVGRQPDMVAAMLAVWQAGGAYVPMDPAFPEARLSDMASDARIGLLVTERHRLSDARWFRGPLLILDDLPAPSSIDDQPFEADPARDAGPSDPAYLIYTSGSTGRPKGVVVPHGAAVNFLYSMAQEPGLTRQDRLLAVTTLSFDIAVLELLLPLMQGGCVVLADRDQAVDGRVLAELMQTEGITVMQATPATWRLLVAAGWHGHACFKALVGGEPLTRDLAELLLARTGELWNMYGPTETTVWSTCVRVTARDLDQGISIGRPIANTEIWVLDEQGRRCPPGLPGEIAIGGLGVTLGYWERPELTADRFIPDTWSRVGGTHLYRTGDLGRWRHDGLLEHQGRLDGQIKLRGYRIELGEIEATLATHPAIRQCVATVIQAGPGDARLVAYLVAPDGLPPAGALREFLRATLPDYMVPQAYVAIDGVPLLPNGKTNRRALPEPDFSATEAPRAASGGLQTETERVIASVWSALLDDVPIGPTDNFFDLGGHSLLAARAVLEIEQRLGVKVAMRQLIFETLRQLAAACDEQLAR